MIYEAWPCSVSNTDGPLRDVMKHSRLLPDFHLHKIRLVNPKWVHNIVSKFEEGVTLVSTKLLGTWCGLYPILQLGLRPIEFVGEPFCSFPHAILAHSNFSRVLISSNLFSSCSNLQSLPYQNQSRSNPWCTCRFPTNWMLFICIHSKPIYRATVLITINEKISFRDHLFSYSFLMKRTYDPRIYLIIAVLIVHFLFFIYLQSILNASNQLAFMVKDSQYMGGPEGSIPVLVNSVRRHQYHL